MDKEEELIIKMCLIFGGIILVYTLLFSITKLGLLMGTELLAMGSILWFGIKITERNSKSDDLKKESVL